MRSEIFDGEYSALDGHLKEIIQIVALIYLPEEHSETIKCIMSCEIRIASEKFMRPQDVNNALRTLDEKALLFKNSHGCYYLDDRTSDYILLNYCRKNPRTEKYLAAIEAGLPYSPNNYFGENNYERSFRDFRNALFMEDKVRMMRISGFVKQDNLPYFYARSMVFTFMPEWIAELPEREMSSFLAKLCNFRINSCFPIDDIISYLDGINGKTKNVACIDLQAVCLLATGDIEGLQVFCEKHFPFLNSSIPAAVFFMKGDLKAAREAFKETDAQAVASSADGIGGFFYCLTLIASGDVSNPFLGRVVNCGIREDAYSRMYYAFKAFLSHSDGSILNIGKFLNKCLSEKSYARRIRSHDYIILAFILLAVDEKREWIDETITNSLEWLLEMGLKDGYCFWAYQAYRLLPRLLGKPSPYIEDKLGIDENEKKILKDCEKKYIDLSKFLDDEYKWARALKILGSISPRNRKIASSGQTHRLIWQFYFYDEKDVSFDPMEQRLLKSGKWSAARPVALKKIRDKELEYLSALDMQIGECVMEREYNSYGWRENKCCLDMGKAVPLLAKHPYVFPADCPSEPLELITEEPQLIVRKDLNGFSISFSVAFEKAGAHFVKETPTRFKVVVADDVHADIMRAFGGKKELFVPAEGEEELRSVLNRLSSVLTVHSDIAGLEGGGDRRIKKVIGDATVHVHLLPIANGIRAELFVRPFRDAGPYFKPGHGALNVLAEINGESSEAARDLGRETENAQRLISHCPSLAIQGAYDERFEFEAPAECLEFLLELREIKESVVIEWPEGGKLQIAGKYDLKDMDFSIGSGTNWFELSADLRVDEKRVISMYELLEKAGTSRFVELGDGEFIALTEELKRKLEEVKIYSCLSKDKIKVHPLNVHQIDNVLGDCASFTPGKGWHEQLEKLRNAESSIPVIPSTFQAELRPYQADGFKWLARLAKWGVGACLADDMGLGKTVQALAAILERAPQGPSLVVAPSSVCMNWISETEKFAPSLNPVFFGNADRERVLRDAKPFDLVIVSYGLLLSKEDKFAETNWRTIVLDEAQFIKNFKARRTQAAFSLKGEFKVITSGTPVENHLSELWTLFNFINPGLLGTLGEFNAKFANPIEKEKNQKARAALKKVIQPFILRRNKTEVLDELPPKTEIDLAVELSVEEEAFYEALRRKSVETINGIKDGQAGAVHLQILAELTKLRQACCHPSLIKADCGLPSSKLKIFSGIVEELAENRHKTLVFSQFVGYLGILRKYCDENGIKYQYLDGSTPLPERKMRVDAFQNGDGDIFLISLKAGGTGLNLTAADYVIHMDPWWNPAVEDQASDRAHRIGQQRPVTVYRLVAKGTVEEKIIAMHKHKRELADSLLDGTDIAAKMSLGELMNLLN